MDWLSAVMAGAVGGLVVEAVAFLTNLNEYRTARRAARVGRKKSLPSWRGYFDPGPDAAAAVTRLVLGAGAGWLFHEQVTSVLAAVAVGTAAPALFAQLSSARSMKDMTALTKQQAP